MVSPANRPGVISKQSSTNATTANLKVEPNPGARSRLLDRTIVTTRKIVRGYSRPRESRENRRSEKRTSRDRRAHHKGEPGFCPGRDLPAVAQRRLSRP